MSETRYFVMHNLGEDGQDEMFELDFERGKEAVELMEQLKYPVSSNHMERLFNVVFGLGFED